MSHKGQRTEITVRPATERDRVALRRIAQRDSQPVPSGPALVAQVAGQVQAAISLADGAVIADPFQPTARLVEMLRIGARELGAEGRPAIRIERPRRARLAFRSLA